MSRGEDRERRQAEARLARVLPFVQAAFEGRQEASDAMLASAPDLVRESAHVAAALADADALRAHAEADAERLREPLPRAGVTPLLALVLSVYVRPGASRHGRARAAAEVLLAAGADPNDGLPRPGSTPLLPLPAAAALVRDAELVEALLAAGADVDAGCALGAALRCDELGIAELLRVAGADVDARRSSPRDVTPLFSVLDEHYRLARLAWLCEHGADLDALRGPHGEAAVHVAARRRRTDAIGVLADHGAGLDAPNRGGMRAFQHAARRAFDDVCSALEAAGAATDLTPGDRFARHLMRGELGAASALRDEHGAALLDPSRADEARLLPDLAGDDRRGPGLELALTLGIPIDARGLDGGSALHQAAWFGAPENLALLLRHDPPLEMSCEQHDATPLGWVAHGSRFSGDAAARGDAYVRCAELLLAAGASLAHPSEPDDRSGAWLLVSASDAVAAVLRAHGATG